MNNHISAPTLLFCGAGSVASTRGSVEGCNGSDIPELISESDSDSDSDSGSDNHSDSGEGNM